MIRAVDRVLAALEHAGSRSRDGRKTWTCPVHPDHTPSLSLKQGERGAVLHCFVGCSAESIVAAIGLRMADLFDGQEGGSEPGNALATAQQPSGLRLADYARAKKLPEALLREFGLRDFYLGSVPTVAIPYRDSTRMEVAARFRVALEGRDRFRWRKGSKPFLYGIDRIANQKGVDRCFLVEGESDCHTLWSHGFEALGVPGASTWRDEWADALVHIERIYAIVEPDRGGETFRAKLLASPLLERIYFVELSDSKDPSELHMRDPDAFAATLERELEDAVPATQILARERKRHASEAWALCEDLATASDILKRFDDDLAAAGSVGEERLAKLVYLAMTSRLLERPVSLAVKGPSSAGKSHTVQTVLEFFPRSAFYALTAMSERALAYSTEPLAHRVLVLYEAAGLEGDFASYLLRSLLSEGRLRYETVEKTNEGMRSRLIEREGPTGLIVTTTRVRLHPENETRLLSVSVDDTREQTRRVLAALAGAPKVPADHARWHALQEWLAAEPRSVEVPYALALAELIPPNSLRLRRDFTAVLALVKAHALLHAGTRECDDHGGIIASLADYEAVRALVADLVAEGIGSSVSPSIRETVDAVRSLAGAATAVDGLSVTVLAQKLHLDKSTASRRAHAATSAGFLRNLEDRRGRPSRYVAADALPDDLEILPATPRLAEVLRGCSDAAGSISPPPPSLDRIREFRL